MYWIIILVFFAGCSCERPAPTEEQTEPIEEPIEMLWSIPYLHVGTVVNSSPATFGDSLVVMSAGVDILLLEQQTGDIRWRAFVDSATNIQTDIFVSDGERLFATHVQDVRAWSMTTGEQLWIADFPDDRGVLNSTIVHRDGRLYVGGYHHAYCLDTITGSVIWSYFFGDSTVAGDMSIYGDKLFVSAGGRKPKGIYLLDLDTGDSLFNYKINNGIGGVGMAPIIEDSIMFVATSWDIPSAIEAWNINTHELVWTFEWPSGAFIIDHGIIVDDILVLTLGPNAIGAWDKNTGERLWFQAPNPQYNWGRLIGYDGRYIYYNLAWRIYVFEPHTGNIVYSTKGPNGEDILRMAVTKDKIFVHGWPENMCFTTYKPE